MIHEQIEADTGQDTLGVSHDGRLIAATVLLSAGYATLRYNVFKGVPWTDWPHFVGNKVLALSGLVLIAIAVLRLASPKPQPIRRLMAVGSGFAFAHTLVSLGLFQPTYFDKFFTGEKLSLAGGASLMIAAAAVALLNCGRGRRGSSAAPRAALPLGIIAFLSGLHEALPALATWFDPATWPGRMPPITLISFLIGSVAMLRAIQISGISSGRP